MLSFNAVSLGSGMTPRELDEAAAGEALVRPSLGIEDYRDL